MKPNQSKQYVQQAVPDCFSATRPNQSLLQAVEAVEFLQVVFSIVRRLHRTKVAKVTTQNLHRSAFCCLYFIQMNAKFRGSSYSTASLYATRIQAQ